LTSPTWDHALERVKSDVHVPRRELLKLIHFDWVIFCLTHEPPRPTLLVIQGLPIVISESVDTHALKLGVGVETFNNKFFLQIIHKLLRSDTLLKTLRPRGFIGISALCVTELSMSVGFLDHVLGCTSLLHYVH
jgi:hypothetical protein